MGVLCLPRWASLLVLLAGLGGVYFGLRALIALSWLIAFNLVVTLLCIIGVVVSITIYGFIVLGGSILAKEKFFYIVVLCVLGVIVGWRLGDIALVSVSSIALSLFTGLNLTLTYHLPKILVQIVKIAVGVGLAISLVLLAVNMLLPAISSIVSGWGFKPVFDNNVVYVPGPMGYRSLHISDVVIRVDVNGSRVLLYTSNWGVIEGLIEKISKWILWITTRLGKIILNLEEFTGQVNVENPPKPMPRQAVEYTGPPPIVLWSTRLSSNISMHLSPIVLVALNIIYGFILVTVGLLLIGKEV